MSSLRQAFRTLAKTPFVAVVSVLSLALGVGANAAIFSLFDQMLLRSLPVPSPQELVNLEAPGPKPGSQSCGEAGSCEAVFSYPMFRDLEASPGSFAGIAAHVPFGANVARSGEAAVAQGVLVSGTYFPVLGVRPALGRLLGPDDDRTIGEHSVAVLGYSYWQNRLGADPSVLNTSLIVNGHPMTIVGVAARGFEGTTLGYQPDVFVPLTMRNVLNPQWSSLEQRRAYWAYLFARLPAGRSLEQAAAELNTTYHAVIDEVEVPLQVEMSESAMAEFRAKEIRFEPGWRGQSSLHREVGPAFLVLFGITGIVLIIACANIVNLMLARGASRSQEMAIRSSLGASRAALLRQLLSESAVLAVLGGVASLVVARATLRLLAVVLPREAGGIVELGLRPSVLGFTAALSLGTAALFGLYPALYATRSDVAQALRAGAGQLAGVHAAYRFRSGLAIAQLALSMVMLVAAGLFIRSMINIGRADLGLDVENVLTFSLAPDLNGYEPARSADLFQRAEAAMAALPSVTSVAISTVPFLAGNNWNYTVSVEGFEGNPEQPRSSRFSRVGPGFFATLGIPLIAGREFVEADGPGAPNVAVVNEAFARAFNLPVPGAIGKRLGLGREGELDIEIVGLVRNSKYSQVKDEMPPQFFLPFAQSEARGRLTFYLRTAIDPQPLLLVIPEVVRGIDPTLPVQRLRTLENQVQDNVYMDRTMSRLSAAFAVLATILAAIGLYGVLAYGVTQRTREIGLRMALGADHRHVRTMVLRQTVQMALVGGGIGLVAAIGLGRAAASFLYGLEGHDPLVVSVVITVLTAVVLAAGYIPARRATRVDPMQALRHE